MQNQALADSESVIEASALARRALPSEQGPEQKAEGPVMPKHVKHIEA